MTRPHTAAPGTPRVLRAMNDRAALELLLTHGPLSRARIGRLTGLSKPTAAQLLGRLERAGLVVACGWSEGRPGPGAQLYGLAADAAHVAALDVTSARIRAAVADVTGRTVGACELPTGPPLPGRQGDGAVRQVVQAVDGAVRDAGVRRTDLHRVAIGTPGAFDPSTGRLRYATHLPGWHAPGLLAELGSALGLPLDYDNDVNLAAVAEHRLGVAQGHDDFVLMWNDRGVGAALVLGGRLHRGWTGGAGEVGFLPVPGVPPERGTAQQGGGFQELAGARAVLRHARELSLEYDDSLPARGAAAALLGQAAFAWEGERSTRATGAFASGTDAAGPYSALLQQFAAATAVGLAAIVSVVDPRLVVLSGGLLSAGGEPLRVLLQAELAELAVPRPRLALGTVTEDAVLKGALQSALAVTREEVFDTSRVRE